MLKNILQVFKYFIPDSIKPILIQIYLKVFRPHVYKAQRDYKFTDEHLKFAHILECMNYVRVAGVENDIPPVYFEFGCHSGRTFSAAVRAASYFKMKNAQFYAFDSFEGLPTTDATEDGIFQAGTFCTAQNDFINIVKKILF